MDLLTLVRPNWPEAKLNFFELVLSHFPIKSLRRNTEVL